MRRGLVAALAVGCAATVAVPVLADTPVDTGNTAATSVTVPLPSGDTLTLDILGEDLSSGPRLVITANRCNDDGCSSSDQYVSLLDAKDLVIDENALTAHLDTTLSGRALSIAWKPMTNGGYEIGGGTIAGGPHDLFASSYAGSTTDVTVQWGDATCDGTGGIGTGLLADAAFDDAGQLPPVSALDLPTGTRLRC